MGWQLWTLWLVKMKTTGVSHAATRLVLPWVTMASSQLLQFCCKQLHILYQLLRRSEVLRSLRHYLQVQIQGHHTVDRLEERGMERGSVSWSSLKGWERAIINQMNIGTVSKAMLGKLLRDGVEHIWAFSSALILSWTELAPKFESGA